MAQQTRSPPTSRPRTRASSTTFCAPATSTPSRQSAYERACRRESAMTCRIKRLAARDVQHGIATHRLRFSNRTKSPRSSCCASTSSTASRTARPQNPSTRSRTAPRRQTATLQTCPTTSDRRPTTTSRCPRSWTTMRPPRKRPKSPKSRTRTTMLPLRRGYRQRKMRAWAGQHVEATQSGERQRPRRRPRRRVRTASTTTAT